ncbi:MAG: alpha/beta fold hydrolase [Halobacteriota archaeon]
MKCEVGDIHFQYETHGEGVPVLMIHGFGIDHRVMKGCMEPIFKTRTGWKRIYFDLPGMGHTPAPRWMSNADQMLEAIFAFVNKVMENDSFVVAGESYGGYLARAIVKLMPKRLKGALLVCPVIETDRKRRELPVRRIFLKDKSFLAGIEQSEWKKMFERVLVVQDKQLWNRFKQDIIPGMRTKDRVFLEQFQQHGYKLSFDVDQLTHPFNRPSLIFSGRQDTSVGYRDSLQLIENFSRGTFAILDRAGHGLEVEQETVFNCLVDEWLNRVEEDDRHLSNAE